jgi:alkylation response protein AidB-like acyl-CoA dehydrogenase
MPISAERQMMIHDRRDLDFLFDWLRIDHLLARDRFSALGTDDISAIFDLAERISTNDLAPHLRDGDTIEPHLDGDTVVVLPQVADAVRRIAEAGLFSTVFDADYGGMQLPFVVHAAALGILMAGNVATASFPLLTMANARVLTSFGTKAQIEAFTLPQIGGTAMGTMCLSEPHAGSSLGDIRTRAEFDGSDALGERYRLFGSKMWISGGDQNFSDNILHLVLAKTANDDGSLIAGSRGISLFLAPKFLPDGTRNDVFVSGLNHKLGYRAIPNCALNFGEGSAKPKGRGGAVAWRIGEVGQGLPQMFQMMNEARISVGLGGAMLACRGYQMALAYAKERRQGRVIGALSHEQAPIIEHADVRRMLLSQKAISQGALSLVLYCARLLDDEMTCKSETERDEAARLLAFLTPIAKTWPSEWAQDSLNAAIQIHGGAGFTRDFEIELLYRDNRLNPIHEGTTGIQGWDLVGRKLRKDKGDGFGLLRTRILATISKAETTTGLQDGAGMLADVLAKVESSVAKLLAEPDDRVANSHATPLLFALGHLVVGWLWLDQAWLANAKLNGPDPVDADFLNGRRAANAYFTQYELPKVRGWLEPILSGSRLLLDTAPDQL